MIVRHQLAVWNPTPLLEIERTDADQLVLAVELVAIEGVLDHSPLLVL